MKKIIQKNVRANSQNRIIVPKKSQNININQNINRLIKSHVQNQNVNQQNVNQNVNVNPMVRKILNKPKPKIQDVQLSDFRQSLKNLNLYPINYKHSGDFGDIMFFLPAMKFRPGNLLIQSSSFTRQRLTPEVFKIIAPLLESQSYVKSVQEYKPGVEIVDADYWRKSYNNNETLAEAQLKQLNVPLNILDEPWISVSKNKVASQVVCRTGRYHGKFPIDIVGNDAIFIGTPVEHEAFCNEFKKIPYYPTKDLLEAAEVIAGADLFIGNQNGCMSICMALKQNTALEVWSPCENVYFKNGVIHSNNIKYYYRR